MPPTAYNAWRLTSLTQLPAWALGLAALALAFAVALSFRGLRSEPSPLRRRVLVSLRVLAALLPGGADGSISTLPLAFKGSSQPDGHLERCIANLLPPSRGTAL